MSKSNDFSSVRPSLGFDVCIEDGRPHLSVPFDLHKQPAVPRFGKPVRKGDTRRPSCLMHSGRRGSVAVDLLLEEHQRGHRHGSRGARAHSMQQST
jgi:hypothetical protein